MLPVLQMNFVIRQRIVRSGVIQLKAPQSEDRGDPPWSRTLPGQSKHFIRHSGVALGDDLRKIASNLSSGYLACSDTIAADNHVGMHCSLDV